MRRVKGIDEAIQVLRPHWQQIDEFFDNENRKFRELIRADHTILGRIIKCHLIVETYIDKYLIRVLDLSDLTDVRLSYYQKVMLLPEHRAPTAILKPGLLRLNQIRNKFAHHLNSDVSMNDLRPMLYVLELSGRRTDNIDTISVMESFTTLACTWLLPNPSHLEDVFARAFRNVVVKLDRDDDCAQYIDE